VRAPRVENSALLMKLDATVAGRPATAALDSMASHCSVNAAWARAAGVQIAPTTDEVALATGAATPIECTCEVSMKIGAWQGRLRAYAMPLASCHEMRLRDEWLHAQQATLCFARRPVCLTKGEANYGAVQRRPTAGGPAHGAPPSAAKGRRGTLRAPTQQATLCFARRQVRLTKGEGTITVRCMGAAPPEGQRTGAAQRRQGAARDAARADGARAREGAGARERAAGDPDSPDLTEITGAGRAQGSAGFRSSRSDGCPCTAAAVWRRSARR
jgi:hypothetical protein